MTKHKLAGPDGSFKEGELIEVVKADEPWTQYDLSDGSVLRVRIVLSEIVRIDNEYDADGNPSYYFKASPVLSVRSLDELKKKVI